ncbi:hypothetical protein L211DRAFT_895415 [Terfezia boudieri ATCC MYA-4762]|uniref:Uncharacterized protein n=1 Tax=Terfezia boudieri ATCC MYA-4762 TaxID=1051890 RepID=A0A3N4LAT3_9PEZI|nr:hypothetical protein L211DRAFT_895415 [Terfezia boudieri ATCC MYA-4762]
MPAKGKKKDNPGKMDRVNPPLKIRIPVTDHPEPQQSKALRPPPPPPQLPSPQPSPPQDGYESDASDASDATSAAITDPTSMAAVVDPVTAAALLFARQIVIHTIHNHGPHIVPPSAKKAMWCLRELLTYIKGDVEPVFRDEVFAVHSKIFTNSLDHGGAAWVNSTLPIPPTTTNSSTQSRPPPQTQVTQKDTATNTDPQKSPPVTHTSSQTTPPTPKLKPPTNSVSTNTDPPPARAYAEAATTTNSPSPRQPPKDKGKAPAKVTPPRAPKSHHLGEYKPWYFTRLQQNTSQV